MLDDLTPAQVAAYWAEHDKRTDVRIAAALRDFSNNYRPRGQASLALTVGTPGTPLVASLLAPWLFVKVPFPLHLSLCHIIADVPDAIRFDIKCQRAGLGEVPSNAFSIIGGTPLGLVAQQEAYFDPMGVSPPGSPWTMNYVEPGSVLSVYITSTGGVITVATINLVGRAV